MATSIKALKDRLPIPSLAEWLLSDPERVHNLYERHSESEPESGRCLECGTPYPCKYFDWAAEAQEYLNSLEQRTAHRIRNGKVNE